MHLLIDFKDQHWIIHYQTDLAPMPAPAPVPEPAQIPDFYSLTCPHCHIGILVPHNELNCLIFRCGVYYHNHEPVNPHLSRQECERLIPMSYPDYLQLKQNQPSTDEQIKLAISGCGKPFRAHVISTERREAFAEPCDYI